MADADKVSMRNGADVTPRFIGRFEILETLGEGAQGVVYLARDNRLEREVAIKSLTVDSDDREVDAQMLLREARMISQFQHPNIVSIYEAAVDEGVPYLVLEFVQGATLKSLLEQRGALTEPLAVQIALKVLSGLSYAHQNKIVHSDLKPGNILLDREKNPKILDFGIARYVSRRTGHGLTGTPRYMAPEYIRDGLLTTAADVFAMGLMLFAMLTGREAVEAEDDKAIFAEITDKVFPPPSHFNSKLSKELDRLVLKSLAKRPKDRFPDAAAMHSALEALADDHGWQESEGSGTTVSFLLRRMKHQSDFPTLSESFVNLNALFKSENESAATIAGVILKDFALTNKLLKVVNSAFYVRRGGKINTVSRAVVMLGFRAIRDLASSLILFDHLHDDEQAGRLKEGVIGALYSAVIARRLAQKSGDEEVEEAFLGGMFHQLGRLLTLFYLNEESIEIERRIQEGQGEDKAANAVLGIGYERLGIAVAGEWGFPTSLIDAMKRPEGRRDEKPKGRVDALRAYAAFAGDFCQGLREGKDALKLSRELTNRYGKSVGVTPQSLKGVLKKSHEEFQSFARILKINSRGSLLFRGMSNLTRTGKTQGAGDAPDEAPDVMSRIADEAGGEATFGLEIKGHTEDASAVLSAGIQDITSSLVADFRLNDVLNIVLETLYRAMDFDRAILSLRDTRSNMMKGRIGLGLPQNVRASQFRFSLDYAPDVFHVALKKNVDIFITDIDAKNIAERIPGWYRSLLPGHSFVLFPIIVNNQPMGMLYADHDSKGRIDEITGSVLNLMKTLRNQSILAIRQKLS